MKLFGYSKKKLNAAGLLALSEVSFEASPEELEATAAFLSTVADQIRRGEMKTDHLHLPAPVSTPSVIVLNPRFASSSKVNSFRFEVRQK